MPNGALDIVFGDGTHPFNIAPIGLLLELEDKCGVGFAEIFRRVLTKSWKVNDVRETIRLGLIGGGMKPAEAFVLVARYVDQRPDWMANALVALAVLQAAMVGVPGDNDVGKPTAERAPSKAAASSAPSSTASAPQSDLLPATSTERPSGNLPPASTDSTPPTAVSPPKS